MAKRGGNIDLGSQDLRIFLAHLCQTGADVRALATRFALPSDPGEAGRVRYRLGAFRSLCEAAAEALQDSFLGLHVAQRCDRGSFGLLEFVFRSAPTLGASARELVRYGALINDRMSFTVAEHSGNFIFEERIPGERQALGRHGNEFAMAHLLRFGREVSGKHWAPRRVWFAHSEPADLSELEAFFQAPLQFGVGANGFIADGTLQTLPVGTADPTLHALLSDESAQQLSRHPSVQDFLARCRKATLAALASGDSSIECVAGALHMSGRTLQRRLATQETTFQAVLDEVRRQQAMILLDDSRWGAGKVALELGYSELGPFRRAFKRWTGRSLREYREVTLRSRPPLA